MYTRHFILHRKRNVSMKGKIWSLLFKKIKAVFFLKSDDIRDYTLWNSEKRLNVEKVK